MKTDFFFQIDNRLHYGIGKSRELDQLIGAAGWKHIALLVDEGVAQHSAYYGEIKGVIEGAADGVAEIRLRGSEEPSYDYLDAVADQVRALDQVDAVIAIGGGSALDMAKAVAALRTNPGPGIN